VKTANRVLRVPPVDAERIGVTFDSDREAIALRYDSAHTAAERHGRALEVVVVPSLDLRDEIL